MTKGLIPPLRKHLETWERDAAAQWHAVIRSPRVLQRIGDQITRTLETYQYIHTTLAQSAPGSAPPADATRMAYLLERIQVQIEALAVRIDRLERKLHDE